MEKNLPLKPEQPRPPASVQSNHTTVNAATPAYSILNQSQSPFGVCDDFLEAVAAAENWAKTYPSEAPFAVEKREKLWFSDVPIRALLEGKRS